MSYEIIYHQVGLKFPKAATGLPEDLLAIVVQMGSNNCYEISDRGRDGCGRRSRDWSAIAFGTHAQVMNQVIHFASYCEGGGVKMRSAGGHVTMESFITTMRNTLKKAEANDIMQGPIRFKDGYISCCLSTRPIAPATDREDPTFVALHKVDEFRALMSDPAYVSYLDTGHAAWNALDVSGPEVRSRR